MNSSIGWQLTKSAVLGGTYIDGSTEIFKSGKWAFLARELIQNSNDAVPENSKLIMKMDLDDLPIEAFPNRENVLKHLNGTLSIEGLPDRCKEFTLNAKKILESDTIRVLKISDYNTNGVTGSDKNNNDVNSQWNALVYDEGNSQKSSVNSTGSFGTGKNAPFALSGINTVFYVTKDEKENYAVEGVSKLFTSIIDGEKYDRKIYYAKRYEDNRLAPLNYEDSLKNLNKIFLREEIGTDVLIFGVDFDKNKIKEEIIQSVVENFFVLIADEKLEISIFGELINNKTLWNVIEKYCKKPIEYTNSNIKYGYIKQYLSVYSKIIDTYEIIEDVPGAGKLKLLISKGNDITGKWVAMFRNKGMKIFDDNIRTAQQNYSAIFFPGDDEVDEFLKKIENPTHDFFDPEVRISDKSEKQMATHRYNQIKKWIRKKIEEYTQISIVDNDYLEGMEEYLQLDDNETENSVVNLPDVEIINYEPKKVDINPMVESDTAKGKLTISDFKPKDGKSESKNQFTENSDGNKGNETKGLIKDYHNKFKVSPKVTTNNSNIRFAFSLDDYNDDKFNIEIETVGEENLSSDYIPKIICAVDLNNGNNLKIKENKILDIENASTNLISVEFDRKFNARYKINIYKERGEDNENQIK